MTHREKMREVYPKTPESELDKIMAIDCPNQHFAAYTPDCNDISCAECWEKELCESRDTYNRSCVHTAYSLLVDAVHNQKEVDMEEVIGYLGQALDDHPEAVNTEPDSIPICHELQEVGIDTQEKFEKAMAALANAGNVQAESPETIRCAIKDSGDRTQFETGAVRDMHDGKGRMDLLPWAAIMEVSKHCENGAKKYGEHNVDKGIPTSSLCDSAARHLAKYLDGWTDEPHLLASAWNLLWAIQMELKNKDMVNTPWKKNENTTNIPRE